MQFKDYYRILGVDPDADEKAIKTAYRKLARKYHPDVSEEHEGEERFKEITEAYNVLKDREKRAEYDELRQFGQHGQEFTPPPGWQGGSGFHGGGDFDAGEFSDFFETLFGHAAAGGARSRDSRGPSFGLRGRDIELDMPIMLEESIAGYNDTLSYDLPRYDEQGRPAGNVRKNLKVTIPAGMTDGETVRLKGQGGPGMGDAPAGDLYLRIRLVPHPLYDVEGHNLIITLPLAPWEAALGTRVVVPTLDGEIRLTIPENTPSGKRLRIRGKGLPSATGKGDLFAVVKIAMPDQQDDSTRELWRQMQAGSNFDPRAEWGAVR